VGITTKATKLTVCGDNNPASQTISFVYDGDRKLAKSDVVCGDSQPPGTTKCEAPILFAKRYDVLCAGAALHWGSGYHHI